MIFYVIKKSTCTSNYVFIFIKISQHLIYSNHFKFFFIIFFLCFTKKKSYILNTTSLNTIVLYIYIYEVYNMNNEVRTMWCRTLLCGVILFIYEIYLSFIK